MPTYKLSILTPDGNVYENDVESLVAPGAGGYFGILAGHANMIAATVPGVFKVSDPANKFFAVGTGVLEVLKDGSVNFLADHAEEAKDEESAKSVAAKIAEH